jgi:hypothetical protein
MIRMQLIPDSLQGFIPVRIPVYAKICTTRKEPVAWATLQRLNPRGKARGSTTLDMILPKIGCFQKMGAHCPAIENQPLTILPFLISNLFHPLWG